MEPPSPVVIRCSPDDVPMVPVRAPLSVRLRHDSLPEFHKALPQFHKADEGEGELQPPAEAEEGEGELQLPEERLNKVILRAVLFHKAIRGFGTLAFVWATVVLLGGFSTLIKAMDFWFVTVIVFMEATRIFTSSEEPENQIWFLAPEAMADVKKMEAFKRQSRQKHQDSEESMQEPREKIGSFKRNVFSCRFLLTATFAFAQLAAVTASIVLSLLRLIKQDFVDQMYEGSNDHRNIKMSLNIFYGLVLVQGIAVFINLIANQEIKHMKRVCLKYELDNVGMHILTRYVLDNFMQCVTGNERNMLNMDLVTFAKELATSDSVKYRQMGLWTLDLLLRSNEYKGWVRMRLQASVETVHKIIYMLGSKFSEEDVREHATRILLELAPDLLVESFPGMLQLVSSLLKTEKKRMFGVQLFEKLMDNADNCRQVAHTTNDLPSKIIDLISRADEYLTSSDGNEIVEKSVKVLHKLASTTGEAGEALRRNISKNVHILSGIAKILGRPGSKQELLVEAIGILACLALDETSREDIATSCGIIRKLVSFLIRPTEIVEDGSHRAKLAVQAAQTLVFLTTESQSNTVSILEEIKPEDIQQFVNMLSHEQEEHRNLIAQLLCNLHAYSNADFARHMKNVNSTLPEVLKAIEIGVEKLDAAVSRGQRSAQNLEELRTKQGKLLESFISLSVQICTYLKARDFADTLWTANLTVHTFLRKIKKILDLYRSPTTEFPGIRRVTVELIIWMLRNDNSYIEVFMQYEMDKALKEVAETAIKLESFKLFYCDTGVSKRTEHICSLVTTAIALMTGRGGLVIPSKLQMPNDDLLLAWNISSKMTTDV